MATPQALFFNLPVPINPGGPTPAQAEAGNYAKRKVKWRGLEISIENEVGTRRNGLDAHGNLLWSTLMHNAYGYIRRTLGADDEQVDCYLGPDMEGAQYVYVIHQKQAGDWTSYDEDKSMLGFPSRIEAMAAYMSHYSDPRFLGEVSVLPVDEFVRRVKQTPKLSKEKRILVAM